MCFWGQDAGGAGGEYGLNEEKLETEQAASFLAERVHDQRSEEEAHRKADGDLDHAVADVEDDAMELVVDVGHVAGCVDEPLRAVRDDAVGRAGSCDRLSGGDA